MTDNIVKHACEVLGVTHKQLADLIGVSKSSVDRWRSTGEIPASNEKAINLLLELHELKKLIDIDEVEDKREKLKALEKVENFEKLERFNELEQENERLKQEVTRIASELRALVK